MYYFAYGANLNRELMLERCPESKPKLIATLHNYKLIFVGWSRQWRGGIASIKPYRGERVLGAIYELTTRDLSRLDRYEGYPRDYSRINITVNNEFGEPVEAVTYISAAQSEETPPSREYLSIVQQGYRDWGLFEAD